MYYRCAVQRTLCKHSIYLYIMLIFANLRQNRFFITNYLLYRSGEGYKKFLYPSIHTYNVHDKCRMRCINCIFFKNSNSYFDFSPNKRFI